MTPVPLDVDIDPISCVSPAEMGLFLTALARGISE
jgi:hypothetical protein